MRYCMHGTQQIKFLDIPIEHSAKYTYRVLGLSSLSLSYA